MPIAFRSVSTRLKADVAVSTAAQQVPLPPGHTTGDFLLMVIVTDDNSAPSLSSNWLYLGKADAGPSTIDDYQVHTRVYYRRDTGSLGSFVTVTFNSSPWPVGSPYVLAYTAAYTGVDTAGPFDAWSAQGTASTAATQTHPQLTTAVSGDWLLTLRTGSAWQARTVTASGGTNTERVDDSSFDQLFSALYDSGADLVPGTQTQRSTTSAGGEVICQGGSTMWSLALKPITPASTAYASPGVAGVTATAYNPTVQAVPGGWDLCDPQGLPDYRVGIDWDADGVPGSLSAVGEQYIADSFNRSVTSGWGSADTGQAWSVGSLSSNFSVAPGTGRHAVSVRGVARFSLMESPSADVDMRVGYSIDQAGVGDSLYVHLAARYLDSDNFYYVRVQAASTGAVVLTLRSRVGGTETVLATGDTGLTHTVGTVYTARFRVMGHTLAAKVWPAGTPEPAAWPVVATTSGLSDTGSVGLRTVVGSSTTNTLPVTFSFRDFAVFAASDPEDVTDDIISDISVTYGRDQERQLSPAAVGSAAFTLNNDHRRYSPENTASPLYGNLNPARTMTASVDFNSQVIPLFRGRIDDFDVHADYGDRTVSFTFLDGLNDLAGVKLSTGVYASLRTGDLVNTVLDLAGWTGARDIDRGATVVRYWWLEGTDALTAITDLVKSEGPPAVAYVDPSGTFVFRDRHHRLQRTQSRDVRATFTAERLEDCTAGSPPATGFDMAKPFTYAHGWRDIVNTVTFDVEERAPSGELTAVWTDESSYALAAGQAVDIEVSSSDPFLGAVTPVPGTDVLFTTSGGGTVDAVLSRDSGASARLTLRAVGGPVTVTSLQLRARSLEVRRTVKVSASDPGSVSQNGERSYPDPAPWANAADAEAIAYMILLHYAQRRPTVQLRVVSQDPAHFMQVLTRTVSDRIRIVNGEMGLDDDFFVERVTHTVQRIGRPGSPPVHAVVLGCEKDLVISSTPFTFDQRGAGFDQGVFDLAPADNPDTVFVFDDPAQGRFDSGIFGT
jgi:hypothetical protein